LNKRGVNKEALDIYGNTPLGVALLAHHHNSAIIMIQKEASVRPLVHKEDPERIAKERKQAALNAGKPVPDSLMTDQQMVIDQEKED